MLDVKIALERNKHPVIQSGHPAETPVLHYSQQQCWPGLGSQGRAFLCFILSFVSFCSPKLSSCLCLHVFASLCTLKHLKWAGSISGFASVRELNIASFWKQEGGKKPVRNTQLIGFSSTLRLKFFHQFLFLYGHIWFLYGLFLWLKTFREGKPHVI